MNIKFIYFPTNVYNSQKQIYGYAAVKGQGKVQYNWR